MFFEVSKLVWMFTVPSTFMVAVAVLGLVLLPFWRRVGTVLVVLGVVGLVFAGLGPAGRVMLHTLEDRFPSFSDSGRVDGIIMLGGSELPDLTHSRGQPSFQGSGERLLALVELSRRYPEARVVFSGGSGRLGGSPIQEADVVRLALAQLGVDPARVEYESTSRNTAENAQLSRKQIDPQPGERWLLVTSAFHMPRAVGCFRQAGFPVTAYPVDFRTTSELSWGLFSSVAEGLGFFDLAAREWIGLAVYRWTGRTSAFLPSP